MSNTDEKIIELSKTKMLLLIAGACAFVVGGLWMVQLDSAEIESQRRFNSPILVHVIGVISITFFGLCGLFGVKKIFDKKPGLILSSAGIFDNSSGVSAGLIPWSEIVGFDIFEVQKQKTLIVKITNPERYIEVGGPLQRTLNRMNFKLCGSPIAITSNSLTIGFDELVDVCHMYFKKYGKNA
ncbi:STM3941 family protein [Undibacterium sp. Rencai35W]|uniref:STM3941 family protein n=1 Tax=Undibacterium sp. Rencai35W TaxID=3413046 RepID=UPI003BF1AEC1